MVWFNLLLLLLLGILGVAGWLAAQRPDSAPHLARLQGIEPVVGLIGLIWGLFLLLRWITSLGVFAYAPFYMVIALLVALVMIGLGYLLALPLLRSVLNPQAQARLDGLAARLAPYKIGFGFAALILFLVVLLRLIF